MSLITRCQKQTLVYWPPNGTTQSGQPIWGSPVNVKCRWDNNSKQIVTPTQGVVLCRAQIITEYLLAVGGIVALGTLDTISYWADPKANPGAYEIISAMSTPNLRNTEVLYEVYV